MAEMTYAQENITSLVPRPNWGAIWAGVFTFIAIWSVFGLLGMAIFAGAANPNAARPVSGMNVGMGIWAIVLTIIAMYVAGRATGHLAGIVNSRDGIMHGMIMFGLAVTAALVIAVWTGGSVSAGATSAASTAETTHNPYLLDMFADLGWIGFVSLFLGWLAAMGGASAGAMRSSSASVQQQVRHA